MKIDKEILEDRQAKLTVEYSEGEFEKIKQRAARKISRKAKIHGFRPGKAPYPVIVNHYGLDMIVQEAIDLLIDEDYSKILEEVSIEPSGVGKLESMVNVDPPKFVLFVPLAPEVDLGDYREIRKPYDPIPFDEKTVDHYINDLRRNSATIVPADRPAEVDDLVYFDLSGEFLNPTKDEDAIITDKTPQQVLIMNEEVINHKEWPYPGFSRDLLGVKAGDVKELQHTYPVDFADEDYQGKTAIFTVEVQSVKALELPDLDDAFVQTMGDFDTPEDFRISLEKQMRSDFEENIELEYTNSVLNEIIKTTKINYPPQMLEHEEEHVLEDIEERLKSQKMDFETYLKLKNTDKDAFITNEVEPIAKQRLERSLVTDALIKAEGLKIKESLMREQFNRVMDEILRSGQAESIQKEMGNEKFSRMLSLEAMKRTVDLQLRNRLKLIGTGQPILKDDEDEKIEIDEDVENILETGNLDIDIPIDTEITEEKIPVGTPQEQDQSIEVENGDDNGDSNEEK